MLFLYSYYFNVALSFTDFFTPEEYKKYLAYLSSERTRQFGSTAPPPTHYKTKAKKNKSKSKVRKSPRTPRSETSEEKSVYSEEEKQTAPKPVHQRPASSRKTKDHTEQDRKGDKTDSNTRCVVR